MVPSEIDRFSLVLFVQLPMFVSILPRLQQHSQIEAAKTNQRRMLAYGVTRVLLPPSDGARHELLPPSQPLTISSSIFCKSSIVSGFYRIFKIKQIAFIFRTRSKKISSFPQKSILKLTNFGFIPKIKKISNKQSANFLFVDNVCNLPRTGFIMTAYLLIIKNRNAVCFLYKQKTIMHTMSANFIFPKFKNLRFYLGIL